MIAAIAGIAVIGNAAHRDRYANLEIDYLLQGIEQFRGLAIPACNMRDDFEHGFSELPIPGLSDK